MDCWVEQILCRLRSVTAMVRVSIVVVYGSAPREAGASMQVWADGQCGTIGGGVLEQRAIDIARAALRGDANDKVRAGAGRWLSEVALGPALGQCCGGRVELLYEVLGSELQWLHDARTAGREPVVSWICHPLDNCGHRPRLLAAAELQRRSPAAAAIVDNGAPGVLSLQGETGRCYVEPLQVKRPQVWLFGAGHTGAALVRQLTLLPCEVTWIDQREALLSCQAAPGVSPRPCDDPLAELTDLPAGSHEIVMTHSHALDYEICRAVLARDNFTFLGLIGSATKSTTFRRRLSARGVAASQIARLCCPVGVPMLRSRRPESIALAIALQLMQIWERPALIGTGREQRCAE